MPRVPPHPSSVANATAATAEVFFLDACPAVLAARREAAAALGGVVAFDVHGAGAWSIDFGRAAIDPYVRADADLSIRIARDEFELLLKRDIDFTSPELADRIELRGDLSMIERLALLFAS